MRKRIVGSALQRMLYVFLLAFGLGGAVAAAAGISILLPAAICGGSALLIGVLSLTPARKHISLIALLLLAGFLLLQFSATSTLITSALGWISGLKEISEDMLRQLVIHLTVVFCALAVICHHSMYGDTYAFILSLLTFAVLWGIGALMPQYVLVSGIAIMLQYADSRWQGEDESSPRRGAPWLYSALITALIGIAAYGLAGANIVDIGHQSLEDPLKLIKEWSDDNLFFTSPRTSFALYHTGYQPLQSRLGGPISPGDVTIMAVRSDGPVLLAGTYKNQYTGQLWDDTLAERRYRYEAFFDNSTRDTVFAARNDANIGSISETAVTVEYLSEGSSTMFMPNRLVSIDEMDEGVPYFNESGEIFSTEDLRDGSHYTVTTRILHAHAQGVAGIIRENALTNDPYYADIAAQHLEVPANETLSRLAADITSSASSALDMAYAIENYLIANYPYTMDVSYPPENMDFVEYFLFEERQGYCTYFASALAVLARHCGIPSRYVEGFSAYPDPSGYAVIRASNAHAWTELYFPGVGWVTFDPTPSQENLSDRGDTSPDSSAQDDEPDQQEINEGVSQPPATGNAEAAATFLPENTPEPSGEEDTPPPEQELLPWWPLLLLLLLLLLAAIALLLLSRRTLPQRLRRADKEAALRLVYADILYWLEVCGVAILPADTPHIIGKKADKALHLEVKLSKAGRRYARCVYGGHSATSHDVALLLKYWELLYEQAKSLAGLRFYRALLKRLLQK